MIGDQSETSNTWRSIPFGTNLYFQGWGGGINEAEKPAGIF